MDWGGRTGDLSGFSAHWTVTSYMGFFQAWGGILGARWRRMLDLVEGGREVFGHECVAGSPVVVSVEFQAALPCTSPVDGYGVRLAEGLDKVVGIFFADVFYTKVVDD